MSEQKIDYLANESEILKGLLEAAEGNQSDTETIEIARNGKVLLTFRIRPLSEREFTECREKATTYTRSRQMGGIRLPEDTNSVLFRSLLIHTATVDEDRQRIWDSKEVRDGLGVPTAVAVIDKVLRAGEKDAVIARIEDLSGYRSDLAETAKN
jgi:hypothetical protein